MPRKTDYCKCRFANCLHGEDRELLKSEAVKVGNVYYHKDCYEAKNCIQELIEYFSEKINPDVVFPQLMRTINSIVFPKDKEGISPERLLFQVKYHFEHGHKIQYPGGLYYAVQDRDAYNAYVEQRAKKKIQSYDFSVIEEDPIDQQVKKVNIPKQKGFEDILRG